MVTDRLRGRTARFLVCLGLYATAGSGLVACSEDDPAPPRPTSAKPDDEDASVAGRPDAGMGRDLAVRDGGAYERPAPVANVTGHGWTWTDVAPAETDKSDLRFTPGQITARAGGAGFDAAADSFSFAHAPLKGDGEIVLRVRSLQLADPRTTAGVMIRAGATDPAAPFVYLGIHGEPMRGGRIVVRKTAGAMAEAFPSDMQIRANHLLRIRREGRRFTFYRSVERPSWVKLGSVEVDFPADLVAGLAVSSGKAGAMTAAEVSDLRIVQLDAAATALGFDLEALGAGNRAAIAGGDVSLSGIGELFVTTSENGQGLLAPTSGAQTLTARVDLLGTEMTPKARVGLTFREGGPNRVFSNARHAMISLDAAGRLSFQRRDRTLNSDQGAMVEGIKAPVWLRLVRYDDPVDFRTRVRGLYSTDGSNYTVLDTIDIALADPVMAGVVYTSGDVRFHTEVKLSGFTLAPTTTPIPPIQPAGDADAGVPADGGTGS